jgi:hypothetical protein
MRADLIVEPGRQGRKGAADLGGPLRRALVEGGEPGLDRFACFPGAVAERARQPGPSTATTG